jgi:hypothetical protein
MCFGLAPGFILRDEIAEELLEQQREKETAAAESSAETPSFATDETADTDLLTGGAADEADGTKTPR